MCTVPDNKYSGEEREDPDTNTGGCRGLCLPFSFIPTRGPVSIFPGGRDPCEVSFFVLLGSGEIGGAQDLWILRGQRQIAQMDL